MSICLSCGAPNSDGSYNCRYCGSEIAGESSDFDYSEFIKKLSIRLEEEYSKIKKFKMDDILEEQEQYAVIANLINNLYVPTDKNSYLAFAGFIYGRYRSYSDYLNSSETLDSGVKRIHSAWGGKLEEAYAQGLVHGSNSPEIGKMLELMREAILSHEKKQKKAEVVNYLIWGFAMSFFGVVLIAMLIDTW